MNKTTVVHCKKEAFDVYIGRPGKWGNPFRVEDYGRDGCIKRYEEWIKQQPKLLSDLIELKGKRLGCWCKPNACHGDVLSKLADEVK